MMVDINKVVIGYCINEGVMLDAYWFLKEFSDIKEGDNVLEKTKYHALWYDNFWSEIKEDCFFELIENNFMDSFFTPLCSLGESIKALTCNVLCKDNNTITVAELLKDIAYYNSEFENAKQRFINYLIDNSDMNIIKIGKDKEKIREAMGFKGRDKIYNYD